MDTTARCWGAVIKPPKMVQKVKRAWKAGESKGTKGSLWGNWSECHCGVMSLWSDATGLPWARLLLEWTILNWPLSQEQMPGQEDSCLSSPKVLDLKERTPSKIGAGLTFPHPKSWAPQGQDVFMQLGLGTLYMDTLKKSGR